MWAMLFTFRNWSARAKEKKKCHNRLKLQLQLINYYLQRNLSLNRGRVSVVFCTGLLTEISLSFYKYYRTTSFQVQVICTRRVNIWLLLRNVTVIYHDISEVSRSIICRGHRLGQITHQQDTSTSWYIWKMAKFNGCFFIQLLS